VSGSVDAGDETLADQRLLDQPGPRERFLEGKPGFAMTAYTIRAK
jgi:hypothetical protein